MKKSVFFLIIVIVTLSFFQTLSSPFEFIQEIKYLSVPYGLKGFIKAGIFSSTYLAGLVAIFLVFFIHNKLFAGILIAFIALAYGGDLFVQRIGSSNTGLSQSLFTLAVSEASRAGDMWLFRSDILLAFATVATFTFLMLIARSTFLKNFRVNTVVGIIFFVFISAITWFGSHKVESIVKQSYPAPIKLLAISLDHFLEEEPPVRILDNLVKPTNPAKYKNIVWIIDESVGGQYLSLNGFEQETTPYLESIKASKDFKNFGVVPSVSNCSGPSNLLLRIGLGYEKSSNFKQNLDALPTIYQYARRAGFKTILIDAQIAEGGLQNHLTSSDLLDIDDYVTLGREFLPNMRDQEALRVVDDALNKNAEQPHFIVIVKWGAHWPYAQGYPQEKTFFKPASSNYYTQMTLENKETVMNSYFNVLKFGVDDFLQALLKDRNLNDQVVFYTSDHGQNLYQNNGVTLTHCHQTSANQAPIMEAFRVPFMVFTKDAKTIFSAVANNETAQEQMFSTTLEMMGYTESLVEGYGPTLFKNPNIRKVREIFSIKRYLDYTP